VLSFLSNAPFFDHYSKYDRFIVKKIWVWKATYDKFVKSIEIFLISYPTERSAQSHDQNIWWPTTWLISCFRAALKKWTLIEIKFISLNIQFW
jgi:hypothetical protein